MKTVSDSRRAFTGLLGGSLLALSLTGCVEYVEPGGGEEKVVLCHKGKSLSVAEPATEAHLRHGDTLGPCR